MILKNSYPKTVIHVTKLIALTVNNNKYYEMYENTDGTFTVNDGRLGSGGVSTNYPIHPWDSKRRETYRFYTFGKDPEEALHLYLEKGNYFWEIMVEGVSQFINKGKIGTFGSIKHCTFSANRRAIFDTELLVQDKILNRYERTDHLRPSYTLRLKYLDYFQQQVFH